MFGKKGQRFDEFATTAIDQAMASLNKTSLRSEFVAANDGALQGYLGKGVDWKKVWANAAMRDTSMPTIGIDTYPTSAAGVSNTTVLAFGSTPYWEPSIEEKDGVAPVTVLAFWGGRCGAALQPTRTPTQRCST